MTDLGMLQQLTTDARQEVQWVIQRYDTTERAAIHLSQINGLILGILVSWSSPLNTIGGVVSMIAFFLSGILSFVMYLQCKDARPILDIDKMGTAISGKSEEEYCLERIDEWEEFVLNKEEKRSKEIRPLWILSLGTFAIGLLLLVGTQLFSLAG